MGQLRDHYQTPYDGVKAYGATDFDNAFQLNTTNGRWYAANFIASASYTAASIRLPLSRSDDPGDITVCIYSVDAETEKPDTLLTSGLVSISDIAEGLNIEWVLVTFDTPVNLVKDTEYSIVLVWPVGGE
jgi:hypothetical protein